MGTIEKEKKCKNPKSYAMKIYVYSSIPVGQPQMINDLWEQKTKQKHKDLPNEAYLFTRSKPSA